MAVDSQLAHKVTALEARVATLEDENKILKGEVKQVLIEIRSALLARENPFDEASGRSMPGPAPVIMAAPAPPVARLELVTPTHELEAPPSQVPEAPRHAEESAHPREPVALRPSQPAAPPPAPEPEPARWSLLAVASIYAWAEETIRRLGPLRFEILLDLCETAGHVSPEARGSLSRVSQLEVPLPESQPSTNETVAILRELEGLLLHDQEDGAEAVRALRRR
ncbi:MAG: hypothetical protein WEC75_12125 [Dehalococcoidia bacterium]